MTTSNIVIRPVGVDERADWEPLWKGYQAFYKIVISDETTAVTWARLHDPAEPMGVLGAYVDGALRGIVHYLFHRSCWSVGNYCYLQDLFVARRRTQSRAWACADPGGGGARTVGGREPRLLAHPRDQCRCTRALRQAGGAPRLHPVSKAFLKRFAGG